MKTHKTYDIGMLQVKAYRKLQLYFESLLSKYDLGLPEWALIGLLRENQALTTSQLAALLSVKPSFVTRTTKELAVKGYIEKRIDDKDSRLIHICLSSMGQQRADNIEREIKKSLKDYLSSIDKDALSIYLNVLNKIANLA